MKTLLLVIIIFAGGCTTYSFSTKLSAKCPSQALMEQDLADIQEEILQEEDVFVRSELRAEYQRTINRQILALTSCW